MAKQLGSEYTFKGSSRFPWEGENGWLNGKVWEIKRGEDFHCEVESFRRNAYHAARKRGGTVETEIDGDTIRIRFVER